MTPGKLNKRVVGDRLEWIDKMVAGINSLPLASYEEFTVDNRNIWAAGFGQGVSEYKKIASELETTGALSQDDARLLRTLAGYRNRLVHFYHDISAEELYRICKDDLRDILATRDAFLNWLKANPDKIDEIL